MRFAPCAGDLARATFILVFRSSAQAEEYVHAYTELGLRLDSGIYGSTFFMLTGFHGLHVTLGAIMLVIIWLRVLRGHFTPDRHFAFEGVAWYWHFVDVVWLGLFFFVYWL
jgi:cytochrome c oxidase subunit 3